MQNGSIGFKLLIAFSNRSTIAVMGRFLSIVGILVVYSALAVHADDEVTMKVAVTKTGEIFADGTKMDLPELKLAFAGKGHAHRRRAHVGKRVAAAIVAESGEEAGADPMTLHVAAHADHPQA